VLAEASVRASVVLCCCKLLCCRLVEDIIGGVVVIAGTQSRCGGEMAGGIAGIDGRALGVAVLVVDKSGGGGLADDGVPRACKALASCLARGFRGL
jgi:hypothetical protein